MITQSTEVHEWVNVIIYARELGFTPAEVKDLIRQFKNRKEVL